MKSEHNPSMSVVTPVAIKAIVTEDLKKYLVFELQEQIKGLNAEIVRINETLENFLTNNTQLSTEQTSQIRTEASIEKTKRENQIKDIEKRINEAKNLVLDTLFHQGKIDSIVSVKPGDNLYHKLGISEIIIKDGIVQEIRTTGE